MSAKSALLVACKAGEFDEARRLLDSDLADLNAEENEDVLFAAIGSSDHNKDDSLKLTALLLARGADANRLSGRLDHLRFCHYPAEPIQCCYSYRHITPLQAAIRTGYGAFVRLLFENGAHFSHPVTNRLSFENEFGEITPDVLKALLEVGPKPTNCPCDWACHALFCVAKSFDPRQDKKQLVAMLVAAGVDVDFKLCLGLKPLQVAVQRNLVNSVRALLENGASLYNSETAKLVFSPRHLSDLSCDVLKLLLDEGPKDDPWVSLMLVRTCCNFKYEGIKSKKDMAAMLMAAGADVNVKDDDYNGVTPLSMACGYHHSAMDNNVPVLDRGLLSFLLEKGADPNAVLDDGRTALHILCASGTPLSQRTLGALLKHGTQYGCSPLQLAFQYD